MTRAGSEFMDPVLSVSDFVAVFNQTLEFAYPQVSIVGELANFRVSKNKWVYFDLKDEFSSLKFFGTVYQLPGPLEEGMMLEVSGQPRLSPRYGFSVNIRNIKPVGEGSIKRAAALLEAKLRKEGLFADERKRELPYPPEKIGLITSSESAAYKDFMKILNARWGGLEIEVADVQVQGDAAVNQIISAIEYFNSQDEKVDVLVITRGGGSPDDLAAFSTEQATWAVATSKIPTLVAVGHEIDVSLAELAADKRASTPSNAAELLVPDKKSIMEKIHGSKKLLIDLIAQTNKNRLERLRETSKLLNDHLVMIMQDNYREFENKKSLLRALSPESVLDRGYAIIRSDEGKPVTSVKNLKSNQSIDIQMKDGRATADITKIRE